MKLFIQPICTILQQNCLTERIDGTRFASQINVFHKGVEKKSELLQICTKEDQFGGQQYYGPELNIK